MTDPQIQYKIRQEQQEEECWCLNVGSPELGYIQKWLGRKISMHQLPGQAHMHGLAGMAKPYW